MKTQSNTQKKQFSTIIGIDLGDTKHAICVTNKDGTILKEYSTTNARRKILYGRLGRYSITVS